MRLRKYGVEATIDFPVYGITGVDLKTDWTPAAADCEIMKDGGASTQCTNTATDEGSTYSIVLTATEMQAARLVLKIVDAATKVFLDTTVVIETYGHASAQHAFDLDTASVAQSANNDTKLSTLISGVDLNADAIKAVSYDESTAFPLTAVNGSTLTEAGGTGDQLTAINLPNQTMDIAGSITGNLIGDVTGNVDGTVTGKTPAEVSDLGTVQSADNNTILANATYGNAAIRTRGDIAWITGGGGGITDILNVQLLLPNEIDLANTALVRLSLGLFNALDDLPTTAEITPGTITIDRKVIGGTSWSNIVNAAACSEAAGLIYYDEVFDSGTGYAEGDSIRITFKSQKITVSANDYEITGTDGWMGQTSIRQTMRGTEGANTVEPDPAGTAAVPGDAMNLAADAIKAVSYDESTAFPLTAVNGSTLTEAGGTGDHLTAIAPAAEYDTEMARITANVATEAKQNIIDTNVDTLISNQGDWATAVGFSTHSAADVKTAMEANNSDLDYLVTDLINRKSIKILDGKSTQYNDAGASLGTLPAGYTDDGTDVDRPRQVIAK